MSPVVNKKSYLVCVFDGWNLVLLAAGVLACMRTLQRQSLEMCRGAACQGACVHAKPRIGG
eukprot:5596504-Amphidinium_carterae.1